MESQTFVPKGLHHQIVALEAIHVPIPTFDLPAPYTHTYTEYQTTSRDETPERIKDATVVICTVVGLDAEMLDPKVSPNLQFIAVMASGTDHIDLEAARRRNIRVCNCPSANIDSVSQHAISLYFAARKSVVKMHNSVVDGVGEWKAKGSVTYKMRDGDGKPPLTCGEEVIGILGYGALGKNIAALAKALGMKVLVAERKGLPSSNQGGLPAVRAERTSFEQVLREASVIAISCPRTAETLNMLSTAEFEMMRSCAVIVNISRGGIIDENALLTALQDRRIFGYGSDVFSKEPVGSNEESPLVGGATSGLNITCSPHIAWFSGRTMANLQALLKGVVEAWFTPQPKFIIV